MPESTTVRRRSRAKAQGPRSTWVRKNMLIDQRKLDAVKRLLKATTETEAVDAALEEIAFQRGLVDGIGALRRAGGLADLFDER